VSERWCSSASKRRSSSGVIWSASYGFRSGDGGESSIHIVGLA